MRKLFVLLLFISFYSSAQVMDNFSDGDFTSNPVWTGNSADYMVNSSFQLQLNNTIASASYLTTPLSSSSLNNMEWRFYIKQSFSPSAANYGRIYLATDKSTLVTIDSAYYLQLGEAGSSDAIELFRQTGTTSVSVARGTNGLIANSFALAIKVTRDANGLWNVYADVTGGTNYVLEATGTDNTYKTANYFGISAVYTISNATKFYFDDFYNGVLTVDTTAPLFLSSTVISSTQLDLLFNEPLDLTTSQTLLNYSVNNGIGNPVSAVRDASNFSLVHLTFAAAFPNGLVNTITMFNIKDIAGNIAPSANSAFSFYQPQPQDLIINEILSNPKTGGVDFVEIYNRSNNSIDLKNIFIAEYDTLTNLPFNLKPISSGSYLLAPGKFLVLSINGDAVKNNYTIEDTSAFINLPSMIQMNISSGTVCLSDTTNTLDFFKYDESMHFALLKDTKGITLERIDFNRNTNDKTNWHSASKASGYGTPGYKNSQYNDAGETDNAIEVSPELFSPDEDGMNDVVNISYKFDVPGYVANISIYDSKGRLTKLLVRNELLGTNGTFSWDGINESKEKARIGIYIFYVEVFDLNGNVKKYKKTCVLGGKLEE